MRRALAHLSAAIAPAVSTITFLRLPADAGLKHIARARATRRLLAALAVSCALAAIVLASVGGSARSGSPVADALQASSGTVARSAPLAQVARSAPIAPAEFYRPAYKPYRAVITLPMRYTVSGGQTLSGLAQQFYGNSAWWPQLWWQNRALVPDPNSLPPHVTLTVGVKWASIPAYAVWTPPPPPAPVTPAPSSTTTPDPQPSPSPSPSPVSTGGGAGGALGACIRNAEEGGSYAWGPGNGGGAYQFQSGTWASYGGAPGTWGSAGPAYQDQIFLNVVAAGPQAIFNAWESDGCPQKFGDF